jgi:hypothetical protein
MGAAANKSRPNAARKTPRNTKTVTPIHEAKTITP